MVSIKDIAKECGVSVATVSKALNDHDDISDATKDKVKKTAKRLGYTTNVSARALKTLEYGRRINVIENENTRAKSNGWAYCVLGDSEDAPAGWVNPDYIIVDPAWYRADKQTPVYAWNDTAASKVALLDAGTTLPILKEEGNWLIVSLRGAVGWIRKGAGD